MKLLLAIMVVVTAGYVASLRRTGYVSEYQFRTVHEVPEKKLDDDLEAKLELLSKILRAGQSRKNKVSIKTDLQSPSAVEKKSDEEDKVVEETEDYSEPRYEFGYGVKDPKSGDHKKQWEKRIGGHVKGVYKFAESDGTQRVVEYEADDEKGFEAKVKNVEKRESEEEEDELEGMSKRDNNAAKSYSFLKKFHR